MEEVRSDPSGDNSAEAICMRLLEPLLKLGGKGYKLFTDSKYPSIELTKELRKLGIEITGTFSCKGKTSRLGAPRRASKRHATHAPLKESRLWGGVGAGGGTVILSERSGGSDCQHTCARDPRKFGRARSTR